MTANAIPATAPHGTLPGTSPQQRRVRVNSPDSILAVVPGLLGFEPGHSIVVIGVEPGSRQVRVVLRYDVPDPAEPALAAALAADAVSLLTAQHVETAVAVGYGTDEQVAPVMAAMRGYAAESEAGLALVEQLRADSGRYWSYVCDDPGCCPADGVPFDVTDHPAARALLDARGPVLASREELAASIAALGGQPGTEMRRATREVLVQFGRCLSRLEQAGMAVSAARLTSVLGQVAVRDAIHRYRAGGTVPPEHAALLTVALGQYRVRDDAWARMDPAYRAAHLRLWTDLTRLARPGFVAAPAALLAFVAWQSGNGALGNVAVDRALDDDPCYSMAELIRIALESGAPPSAARLPMTPEEVAASYDAQEAAEAGLRGGGAVAAGPEPTEPAPPSDGRPVVGAGEAVESDRI